jgi:glycosyltransferase involved in cell wall biosynthesis
MSKKVTVIMPIFNSALYLREAVDSILSQSHTNLELICIDDCSTDESLALLKSYTDSRLKIVALSKNGGVSHARNTALELATGDYIAFLDSDDIAHPDRLEKQISFLEKNPEADGVFARVRLIDVYGNPSERWLDDENYLTESDIRNTIATRNCLSQPAACFRATSLLPYRYSYAHPDSEDWALWIRMVMDGKRLFKIDEALVDYRIRASSETGRSNQSPIVKMIRFRTIFLQETPQAQMQSEHIVRMKVALRTDKSSAITEQWLKRPARLIMKIWRANPVLLCFRFVQFLLLLRRIKNYDRIFFFPFYHVGGAEKVHASIVQAMNSGKNLVLFTKKSDNSGFQNLFASHAQCENIWEMCWYPGLKSFAAKRLAKAIEAKKELVLMSSNSVFFYQMLAHLNGDNHTIDLIHAFVHPEEPGPEKWSIPVLDKISHRVFISEKAIEDARLQYKKLGIEESFLKRIVLIRNFVDLPSAFHQKTIGDNAKLIYVGRGTAEKRVHLAASIAKELNTSITMIGDVEAAVPPDLKPYCTFKGILTNENSVYEEINQADVLLLTSSREGLPMVIMEAMACGVIPICTAVGDLPNVIQHEKTGILLPVSGESQIISMAAQAIRKLQLNPEHTQTMQQNARELAKSLFGKSQFVEKWNALLSSKK